MHKDYKCFDISTGRVYILRDIVFDKSVFPFASLYSTVSAQLRAKILLLPPTLQPTHVHVYEGYGLQFDANDPNLADHVVAESQDTVHNSEYGGYSGDFSSSSASPGEDSPNP
jgi:hypothetical protein